MLWIESWFGEGGSLNPDGLARVLRLAVAAAAFALAGPVEAQHLFKCGSTFQDRPCDQQDVQQRFSHTQGSFTVEQVNADTDKDCADAARNLLPYWQRMNAGESFEKVKGEIDARPIAREDKSRMRDVLLALKQYKGTPNEVRSELERHCMNYKRLRGLPTERDVARNVQASTDPVVIRSAKRQRAVNAAAEARARAEEQALRLQEERQRGPIYWRGE